MHSQFFAIEELTFSMTASAKWRSVSILHILPRASEDLQKMHLLKIGMITKWFRGFSKNWGRTTKNSFVIAKALAVSWTKRSLCKSTSSCFGKLWTASIWYIWVCTLKPCSIPVKEHCSYRHQINSSIIGWAKRKWNCVWDISKQLTEKKLVRTTIRT